MNHKNAMNIEEFKSRFRQLRHAGFVKSLRRGPTGVGYTLETKLGLTENNLALPDIENAEIKTHRHGSHSMITLFTFNKHIWQINHLDAIKKYGAYDNKGRLGMYYTITTTPNNTGLFLKIDANKMIVQHTSGEWIAAWEVFKLVERFNQKFPALVFISAYAKEEGSAEYFHFYRAQLMNKTSSKLLIQSINRSYVFIDFRLHNKGTMARNHGTAFRVHEDRLPLLFEEVIDI